MKNKNVKFISYNGKSPNLCSGTLVLEINNKIIEIERFLKPKNEKIYVDGEMVFGALEINFDKFPQKLSKYFKEIETVIKKHINLMCCGGCE